jgi:hypothetical protein
MAGMSFTDVSVTGYSAANTFVATIAQMKIMTQSSKDFVFTFLVCSILVVSIA